MTHVFWRSAVPHLDVVLQGARPQEPQIALAARVLLQSAAILFRQKVRMRSREVIDETGQPRELASAAVARLLESALVQLTLVDDQRRGATQNLAALVTAVFNCAEMNS